MSKELMPSDRGGHTPQDRKRYRLIEFYRKINFFAYESYKNVTKTRVRESTNLMNSKIKKKNEMIYSRCKFIPKSIPKCDPKL